MLVLIQNAYYIQLKTIIYIVLIIKLIKANNCVILFNFPTRILSLFLICVSNMRTIFPKP